MATSCGRKITAAPGAQHTQLFSTVGGHQITAEVEGEAGCHLYLTPQHLIITSQWSSFLVTTSGVYFGTNELIQHRWVAISDDVPVAFHITHDEFSVQYGTNLATTTPNLALEPTPTVH